MEYMNVDLLCRRTGLARLLTERNSPVSNGKPDILNMAQFMVFSNGLLIPSGAML
jgi:hypothetical protein